MRESDLVGALDFHNRAPHTCRHPGHVGRGAPSAQGLRPELPLTIAFAARETLAGVCEAALCCVVVVDSDTHRIHSAQYSKPRGNEPVFTVVHYAGPVEYNVAHFMKKVGPCTLGV